MRQQGFLPATKEELEERGIAQPDFVYVIGDAYVDHPSFGPAIIGRVLESHGYSVAILVPAGLEGPGEHSDLRRNPGSPFWSPPEIWIPWSTTIPCRKSAGRPTPLHRAASWESGRIGRTWFTAI